MSISVHVRAKLTPDEAERLSLAVERGTHSRSWLAGQIIRQWLTDPHRKVRLPASAAAAGLTPAQLEISRRRERILKQWQRCVGNARKHGRSTAGATDAFLLSLPPVQSVCRCTLYNWAKRYQGHGIAGLADRLSTRVQMDHRGAIKPASTAG